MLTFKSFAGINNVLPAERLGETELAVATDVNIGLTGELTRRAGYARESMDAHTNLHQGEGFLLSTKGLNGDLTSLTTSTVLYPSLGHDRVWYCNLPDGRTVFSNGLISGVTDGASATAWGVPVPSSVGAATDIAGSLFPGSYQYQLTYVRLSDGLEGGPAYSTPVSLTSGGIFLSGLPTLTGHKINVYMTGHNGGAAYLAGSTTNGLFSFTGKNDTLVVPCRTDMLQPPGAGRLLTFWRGRVLWADGSVLRATRPNAWEIHDPRRDFKQFESPITCVMPVDNGIYVGTETELAYLAGVEFDKLAYRKVVHAGAMLGSGVQVRGELLKQGEGAGIGTAAVCIADGRIIAGFNDGQVVRLTEGRYHTTAAEVFAFFRMLDGVPQYVAVPR